jgi:menaquinone-dependent protoporphyrinogen oxidase
MGKWLEAAQAFVGRHSDALLRRPTWVFSSGPIGDPPRPAPEPGKEVIVLPTAVRANDHGVFAGKLDPGRLGLRERTIVRAVRAPAGDFREWAKIDSWAEEIADRLAAGRPPG